MKTKLLSVLVLIILAGSLMIPSAFAKDKGIPNAVTLPAFVPGEILVKPKPGKSLKAINSQLGSSTLQVDKRSGVEKVKLPPGGSVKGLVNKYANNPDVDYAEPNYILENFFVPDDTYYSHQWALTKIQAPQAWALAKGSSSVVIAIIDSGIDYNHPDLKGKIVSPYNSVIDSSSLSSVLDDMGHGTHVAGIAAATINNGMGIAGVGGDISIMPIKAGNGGNFTSNALANAIYYAVDNGARVINMSLGGYDSSYTVQDAVDYAWSQNVVVVAASGNDATNNPAYPAAYSSVISVAATTQSDDDAQFSNWGDWIETSAPGVNVFSTTPTYSNPSYSSNYSYATGTSMASPIVAGLAALTLSAQPTLTNNEIRELISINADDIGEPGYDYYTGYGRVNAYRTLTAAMAPTTREITESIRLSGNNRLSTAVAISRKSFPDSETADAVLLATGSDFPDALAGTSLGILKNAPLLLASTYQNSKVTLDEIERVLKPGGTVYILGSESVVERLFATNLQKKGYDVKRLAGPNRYATALEIAKEVNLSSGDQVIVATGLDFPDALSVSPYAAAKGIPILLVEQNKVPADVSNYLETLQPTEITIVGGIGAISDSVKSDLEQLLPSATTRRLGGTNRFETCVAINQALLGNNSASIFVATAQDFPDALAGSVLAGINDAPIILVNPTRIPDVMLGYLEQLSEKKVVALGSEGVVSKNVFTRIIGYVK